ncbi:MAG: DHHW family protein [Clostridia bacterium]
MKKPGFSIFLFLLALTVISVVSGYAFFDKQTISEKENRTLAKQPDLTVSSWFSGDFARDMEQFLTDHIFERTQLISAAQSFEKLLERKTEIKLVTHATDMGEEMQNAHQPSGVADVTPGTVKDELSTTQTESDQQDQILLADRILTVYKNNLTTMNYYEKTANSLYALFPDYVKKYCFLVPSRIAFEAPEYTRYSDDQQVAIQTVYQALDNLVTKVNVFSALKTHSEDLNQLYFRTDHHWTSLAAYYAAEALWKSIDMDYVPIEKYEQRKGKPFLGYLYAQNPSSGIDEYPDELLYYVKNNHICPEMLYLPDKDGKLEPEQTETLNPLRQGYYTFLGSSFSHVVIDGSATNGSCLLVIADSYGNVLAPWLAENFDTVIQIDPRYFSGGKVEMMALVSEYGVTDFMLVNYSVVLQSPYFVSQMENLLK